MKLKNGEIWRAYPQLVELSKVKLPVKSSLGVARLVNKLTQPYTMLSGEQNKLIEKYGSEDKETKQKAIKVTDKNWPSFVKEFDELMDIEHDEDINFEKAKIPEKIAGTCDKCNHNMDVVFQIEPLILIPLEKFIEVV